LCKTARRLASLLESSTMGQSVEHMRRLHARVTLSRRRALSIVPAVLCQACRREHTSNAPSIEFTRIPQADPAGSARNDIIEGRVTGGSRGQKIVLYAKTGKWWVQPLIDQPMTNLRPDFGWTNATHLGTHYAALLVKDGYRPQTALDSLPQPDSNILAVAVVSGAERPPSPVVDFSRYQWRLRSAPSSRGGQNVYSPSNISVDEQGAMHIAQLQDGKELELRGSQPHAKSWLRHLQIRHTGTGHAGACRRLRNIHL
jgi:hypothetical protein